MIAEAAGSIPTQGQAQLSNATAQRVVGCLSLAQRRLILLAKLRSLTPSSVASRRDLDDTAKDAAQQYLLAIQKGDAAAVRAATQEVIRCVPETSLGNVPLPSDCQAAQTADRLSRLQSCLCLRLAASPEEELRRSKQAARLKTRAETFREQSSSLETLVQQQENELAQELEERQAVVEALEDQIAEMLTAAQKANKRVLKDVSKRKEDLQSNMQDSRDALEKEIERLQKLVDESLEANHKEERQMRQRKNKVEEEVRNWIMKYDEAMLEKQKEIDETETQHRSERQQLDELQRRFAVLEREYNDIMEKRRLERERREQQEAELAKMTRAVLLLQAVWRMRLYRKKKAKKAKGKKKGGKKKK